MTVEMLYCYFFLFGVAGLLFILGNIYLKTDISAFYGFVLIAIMLASALKILGVY